MSVPVRVQGSNAAEAARAEAEFRTLVEGFGGLVVEPRWLGTGKPHRVICAEGHEVAPRPNNVRRGAGICGVCFRSSARVPRGKNAEKIHQAEAAFRARVAELGARLVEPKWLGATTPHRVICAEGHECAPSPNNVANHPGICDTCARLNRKYRSDTVNAEAEFRSAVVELGATLLDTVWSGCLASYRMLCSAGHECRPLAQTVRKLGEICSQCPRDRSRRWDSIDAEQVFKRQMAALGATLLDTEWRGIKAAYAAICLQGHACSPRPNSVQQGRGICLTCAGKDPAVSKAAFYARVSALGGQVLEPTWLGIQTPHRVRCKEGHEVTPRPADVRDGHGICRVCVGSRWDIFYVVRSPAFKQVKFGITTEDPRPRLRRHKTDGFRVVDRLLKNVESAHLLEQTVRLALKTADFNPAKGREYYDVLALPVILDIVDHWEVAV